MRPVERSNVVRFGVFELDPRAGELRRNGLKLRLQEQSYQILTLLLERPGDVVTREEIQKELWADGTIVEFDHSINAAVKKLRQALGDSAENPRFVETLPRRGYRFLVPVERPLVESDEPSPGQTAPPEAELTHAATRERDAKNLTQVQAPSWSLIKSGWRWAAVLLVLLVAGVILFLMPRPTRQVSVPSRPLALTGNIGWEHDPAFSPDGKQVAFSWAKEVGANSDIYVKLVGVGAPLRLTTSPGISFSPVWSPDARYIAFLRNGTRGSEIFVISALGGPERNLGQLAAGRYDFGRLRYPRLAWSPDAKYLATVDKGSSQSPDSIFLLSVENGERRRLTSPPPNFIGDELPSFSPDGRKMAWFRDTHLLIGGDIYVLPLTANGAPAGEPRRVTFDQRVIAGLDWTPDGREIVFSSNRKDAFRLWRVSASGGAPSPLVVGEDGAYGVSVSRREHRLAYSRAQFITSIWRIEGPGSMNHSSAARSRSPTKLIYSNGLNLEARFSPDGKKIAFISDRSGTWEVWVCDSDGSNPVQLTFFSGPWLVSSSGSPDWSPDGRNVVFDSSKEGHTKIYIVSSGGGLPRRITAGTSQDVRPSWSRDGRWIYFDSDRSGTKEIWKVSPEGGDAMQVTKQGGYKTFESADGRFLYYAKTDASSIWKTPVQGGQETQVLDHATVGSWTVAKRGIYFVDPDAIPLPTLGFFNIPIGRVETFSILPSEMKIAASSGGLAVSPDDRWILYMKPDHVVSALVLVENFH